jgi:hypothetical protein
VYDPQTDQQAIEKLESFLDTTFPSKPPAATGKKTP